MKLTQVITNPNVDPHLMELKGKLLLGMATCPHCNHMCLIEEKGNWIVLESGCRHAVDAVDAGNFQVAIQFKK